MVRRGCPPTPAFLNYKLFIMKTITLTINYSKAIHAWMSKEEGSWEDHNKAESHVFSILSRCKGRVKLTEEEARTVITSGRYQSTAWEEDEIEGGARTMQTIKTICDKLSNLLK